MLHDAPLSGILASIAVNTVRRRLLAFSLTELISGIVDLI